MRVIVALLVSLSAFLAVPADAEDTHSHSAHSHSAHAYEGHLGQGHAAWHDAFYRNLLRPDTKTSCCNLTDCRPTSGRMIDGHYEVMVNGARIAVPADKIIPTSAPDGGYHVCAPVHFEGRPNDLYCVVLAPEG